MRKHRLFRVKLKESAKGPWERVAIKLSLETPKTKKKKNRVSLFCNAIKIKMIKSNSILKYKFKIPIKTKKN